MIDNAPVNGDRGMVVMIASIAAYGRQIGQSAYLLQKGIVGSNAERDTRPDR